MDTDKKETGKETVVGTFKQTREVLPNGDTKEIREEKIITVRRTSQDANVTVRHTLPDPNELS